jgi:hypothetical protein
MKSKNIYEQIIEHIINDEEAMARELFHNEIVKQSRNIYNDLVAEEAEEEEEDDEEEMEESFYGEAEMTGDQTDDMLGDIDSDEAGMGHDDDADHDEFGHDEEDEFGGEEHDEGGLEDRVVDLEDALDELKAEFEQLMAGEAGEEEHDDMDFGSEEDEPAENFVREYVEKVAKPSNAEGQPVGAVNSSPSNTNAKSPMNAQAAMAGAALKFGGTGENPDDKQYKKPSNAYTKGEGNLKGAGSFENVPGAKAGKAFSNAKKPVTKDGAANDKSIVAKK